MAFLAKQGFVYAVRSHASGLIKIGWTSHIRRRLSEIAGSDGGRGESATLDVLTVVRGSRQLEKELHSWFAESRRNGEWFSATETMLAFLATLPSVVTFGHFVPRFRTGPVPRRERLAFGPVSSG